MLETISVVLNTGTLHGARCIDSIALFDYAYNNFEINKIANKDDIISQMRETITRADEVA